MASSPPLFLRSADRIALPSPPWGGTSARGPSKHRQIHRLQPRFTALEKHIERRTARLETDPAGALPEQVVVLETIGAVSDFLAAVQKIPSLEWLAEIDEDEIAPDDDFYFTGKQHKPLKGRLYFVLTDHAALRQFLSLWKSWVRGRGLPKDHGSWWELFRKLKDVRLWGVEDRLAESGILEDWRVRVEHGLDNAYAEIELWYRENATQRDQAERKVRASVAAAGGTVHSALSLEGIRYHAVLAELPAQCVESILMKGDVHLVQADDIQFFRRAGQVGSADSGERAPAIGDAQDRRPSSGSPLAALLDGLPIERHELLEGRLVVDDPDGWAATYPVRGRNHGTAMASMILHGDLSADEPPLDRPLYVRPLLRPNANGDEFIPETILAVDLLHRAIRRIRVGEPPHEVPAAPEVVVVNLSLGDPSRPYTGIISPWARLLDWLAWEYGLLFVVSAGNQCEEWELDVAREELASLDAEAVERALLCCMAGEARHRRILSPAESFNALTVGALHQDAAEAQPLPHRIDPFVTTGLPSPISAQGRGHQRSIKPDVLAPGGRVLLTERLGNAHARATLLLAQGGEARPPGQRVAAPGSQGSVDATRYTQGTSNAAALVTRRAARIVARLSELANEPGGDVLGRVPTAVWTKLLLIHGAEWGKLFSHLENVLRDGRRDAFREQLATFIGFGAAGSRESMVCPSTRATLLGGGSLRADQGDRYRIPLPPSLSGRTEWRRLTITLCWFTPINVRHRKYRRAHLWFQPPSPSSDNRLGVSRQQADWRSVQRGTTQYEILGGEKATAFLDGDALEIPVYCRADAGELPDQVPYALAVSLEVEPTVTIPIYDEIRARVSPLVHVRPAPGR